MRPTPISTALVTAVLGMGTLLSHGFGLSLVPAMLPRIADDLGAGYGVLGTVAAAGLVAYTVAGLGAGWIVDRMPARALLVGSFVVSIAGLAAAGAASSALTLTAAVVVLGAAAPVSWAVTLHVAGETVAPAARAVVMAGAASGAALGVLVNGVLVQTSADLHSWRVSFVVAAVIGLAPIAGAVLLFREAIPGTRPADPAAQPAGYRAVAASPAGRLVVGSAMVAGAVGFPFTVFLTATALDELAAGATRAAALWWLIGIIGTLAGPLVGRVGDRGSPIGPLAAGAVAFASGLGVLAVTWHYAGLVLASVGLAVLYYPIWGLVGALASRHFPPAVAVRAITLGLVGAALGGAVANAAAGAWIEATGSFREPVALMAAVMGIAALWQVSATRSGRTAERAEPRSAYDRAESR